MNRIHSLYTYFRRKYTCRVQKLPLDAGLTCPNRDGTVAKQGCTFCDTNGSGTGLAKSIPSLLQQATHWKDHYSKKKAKHIAYLQSFSNTHCSLETLDGILTKCMDIPDLIGIAIGTRVDCLNTEKLERIARIPYPERWLEIGVQSIHEKTLQSINRGHTFEYIPAIVKEASNLGIFVCLHIMAGLPGETIDDFLETVHTCIGLPIHALKIHNLFIAKGTVLEKQYNNGKYVPLTKDEYFEILRNTIPYIPSRIVLQRINGDPERNSLIAPAWTTEKNIFTHEFPRFLLEHGLWQGSRADVPNALPLWFSVLEELPTKSHEEYYAELQELYKKEPWLEPPL